TMTPPGATDFNPASSNLLPSPTLKSPERTVTIATLPAGCGCGAMSVLAGNDTRAETTSPPDCNSGRKVIFSGEVLPGSALKPAASNVIISCALAGKLATAAASTSEAKADLANIIMVLFVKLNGRNDRSPIP